MKKHVVVIKHSDITDFSLDINHYLNNGYSFQGNLVVTQYNSGAIREYVQLMIKETTEK